MLPHLNAGVPSPEVSRLCARNQTSSCRAPRAREQRAAVLHGGVVRLVGAEEAPDGRDSAPAARASTSMRTGKLSAAPTAGAANQSSDQERTTHGFHPDPELGHQPTIHSSQCGSIQTRSLFPHAQECAARHPRGRPGRRPVRHPHGDVHLELARAARHCRRRTRTRRVPERVHGRLVARPVPAFLHHLRGRGYLLRREPQAAVLAPVRADLRACSTASPSGWS